MPVYDTKGNEIKVGTRISVWAGEDEEPDPDNFGTVTGITDWDGDADDYGRPIAIYPQVLVRFDNGDEDAFGTYVKEHQGYWVEDPDLECEDLDVIEVG